MQRIARQRWLETAQLQPLSAAAATQPLSAAEAAAPPQEGLQAWNSSERLAAEMYRSQTAFSLLFCGMPHSFLLLPVLEQLVGPKSMSGPQIITQQTLNILG